jgi:hypothetical protein
VPRRKTALVRCPQCGKDFLETEMDGERCRWCVLQGKVATWAHSAEMQSSQAAGHRREPANLSQRDRLSKDPRIRWWAL